MADGFGVSEEKRRKAEACARIEAVEGAPLQPDGRDFRLRDGRRVVLNYSKPVDRGNGVSTYFLGLPQRLRPTDVSVLLLGDADFVLPAKVLLEHARLYTHSSDGRATPFLQSRNGRYSIRLPQVDGWVALDPYRDAYSVVATSSPTLDGGDRPLGTDFIPADESQLVRPRDPFEVDPDIVDRGTQGHARTLNQLARFLRDGGIDPRLPAPGEPQFDLAWRLGDDVWVAEVKSITASNAERQLRLGLGQLLRYRFDLAEKYALRVDAALVVETEPPDQSWAALCRSLDVVLCWPPDFDDSVRK